MSTLLQYRQSLSTKDIPTHNYCIWKEERLYQLSWF